MLPSDFVIVGAGLAGISLGVRLSENPDITVTVLEAGGATFHDINIDTPAYFINNLGNPTYDWSFFSIPQKNLGGRSVYLPRGKSIGGSTLLNLMEINRAPSMEYDAFGTLGSDGWGWRNLLPYFKKAETLSYANDAAINLGMSFNRDFQGTSGPVQRTIPRFIDVMTLPFLRAAQKALGIKYNPDPNEGDNTGAWISTRTVDSHSIRSSAASAYYEPNDSRPNLNVITGALATKIITSGRNVVATGVQFIKDGKLQTINATKEVILSAGSYQTPHLLELSGIGDPVVLKKFDIPIVVDLPGVGNNLRKPEHGTITYTAKMTPGYDSWGNMSDPTFAMQQEEIYNRTGGGMLSWLPSAFVFLPFKNFDDGTIFRLVDSPLLPNTRAFSLQKGWANDPKIPFIEFLGYDRFQPGATAEPEPNSNYLSISAILLHPFSRGSVHLSSSDPTIPPNIDPNFLDSEIDVQIALKGYKLIRKVCQTEPLKNLITAEVSPGSNVDTDEGLVDYIRKNIGTTFHPVATTSMLPLRDGGVVDAKFRVYGTKNLRVVDASVIPIHISAHLQDTLYAIAEKAADVVKRDNNC